MRTNVIINKGDWSRWKQLSFRILLGSWCVAAFVLVNAYSTTLISNLTAPKLTPVARSYEDVASPNPPKNVKLIVEKNEIGAQYAMVFIIKISYRMCLYTLVHIL